MARDAPQLPPVLTEQQRLDRPIPDMTANINALVNQVRAIIDGYQAAGEVTIKVDAFGMPGVFTLHIPLRSSLGVLAKEATDSAQNPAAGFSAEDEHHDLLKNNRPPRGQKERVRCDT